MPRLQPPLQLRCRNLFLQVLLLIISRVKGRVRRLDVRGDAIELLGMRGGGHLGDGFGTIMHRDGAGDSEV